MSTEEEKKAKCLESLEKIRAAKGETEEVTLESADLSQVKEGKFSKGVVVNVEEGKKLPSYINLRNGVVEEIEDELVYRLLNEGR